MSVTIITKPVTPEEVGKILGVSQRRVKEVKNMVAEKAGHKTQIRRYMQKRVESLCAQDGCKFKGKPAQQGICFTRLPDATTNYVNQVMKSGEQLLKEIRSRKQTPAQWVKTLESYLVCTWANNTFTLDELVYLRAENSRLRQQLGKKPRK